MTIEAITYRTITNQIVSWICSNATNVANYAGIPAHYKPTWAGTSGAIPHTGGQFDPRYSITITVSIGNQVSSATVSANMTTFLNSIGLTSDKLDNNLAGEEFYDFINDMATFCSTRLAFATSQFDTNRFLIYDENNSSYVSPQQITGTEISKIIYASDANNWLNCLTTIIQQIIRNKPCQYKITVS